MTGTPEGDEAGKMEGTTANISKYTENCKEARGTVGIRSMNPGA